jgi:hypothetical protein
VEGDIQDFLGININRKKDGSIHLSQPQLIEGTLKDLRLGGEHTYIKVHTLLVIKNTKETQGFSGF